MPSGTGFIYHDIFLQHDTGLGHPERPGRLSAVTGHLRETGLWERVRHLSFVPAAEEWITKVHTPRHLNFVREACRSGQSVLDDGDTHASLESFDIAQLAAGGVLAAVDAVVEGKEKNAFCAVRPPGHHAESDKVMGFCLFNNVAIAARYAQEKHHLGNIAIIDWDVHHGNGTQEIFYADKSVLYISTHQYPFYPGTGARSERGDDNGEGYTLNIPMAAGSAEEHYLDAFRNEIIPALAQFHPDLLILSAGFDAHKDDPLANINLTEQSFKKITEMVCEYAEKNSGGRIVSVLEGGYNILALSKSVEAHLGVLLQ
ncbi:MAG TPA: histone deacetylase [Bacteroidota bacterium]|nr:histone deacetylase [Bacteroidota bacterium]